MNDLERRMDGVDLAGRPRNTSVGDYNSKRTVIHTRPPLLILAVYRLPSGSPYQQPPMMPPSPNMAVTNLGYHPPAPAPGYPPSNQYPPSGHDIHRAPSPYRGPPVGAPEPAILSRSRAPSPNPMGGPIYGQRAPSPNPMGGPGHGVYQRAPSPSPGAMPPYGGNRSRAPSPLPGAPPPYSGQPGGFQYSNANALPRSPRHGGGPLVQEPQMLPPPDGFSRPANLAQSYTFFDTMKIQDMDDFYENMPRMPKVLVPHDVYHEDWIRFIQVGFGLFLFLCIMG